MRIVREGGIPLTFFLSIRERAHRGHIAHGIGTTEGPHALRPHDPSQRACAPARPRALRRSRPRGKRNRSRGQSGLFMRMRKTPSKAL